MAEMRYDPAMSRYVRERLKTADLSYGIAFDGYPATLVQAEGFSKMVPDLKLKPIAFQLQVPDDVIRERSKTTGQQSDNPQILSSASKTIIARWTRSPSTFPGPTSCLWMPTDRRPRCGRLSRLRWMGQRSSACESSRSVYLLSIFVKRRRTGYRSSWQTKSAGGVTALPSL
jgi:adenylate kinase family enzyme